MLPYKDLTRRDRFPLMTILLILANVAVFGWEFLLQEPLRTDFVYRFSVIPREFLLGENLPASPGLPPLASLVTSLFLHGGFLHLFGNLLYLWIFGDNVEDRIGSLKFLLFYIFCGILASIAQIAASTDSEIPMLGASGAIAGVLGAYLWLFPRSRVLVLVPIFFFLRTVVLPAWLVIGGWIFLQILEVRSSSNQPLGGIAYYAHIGGFVAGLLLLPAFRRKK